MIVDVFDEFEDFNVELDIEDKFVELELIVWLLFIELEGFMVFK